MALIHDIYEKVRLHLLNMPKQAKVGSGCQYRTPDGSSCAAGCLIADEHYSTALEGYGSIKLPARLSDDQYLTLEEEGLDHCPVMNAIAKSLGVDSIPDEAQVLLAQLQRFHDIETNWTGNWTGNNAGLTVIAKKKLERMRPE